MAEKNPIQRKQIRKKITIKRELLNSILNSAVGFCYETGGFVGFQGEQLCCFMFDPGTSSMHMGRYYPNVNSMSLFLEKQRLHRFSEIGILHTHLSGDLFLSRGDIKYIHQIFYVNLALAKMYFPIVIPGKKLCIYLAERQAGDISIKSVIMKIT